MGDVLEPLERATALATGDPAHWQGVVATAARIGDDDLALQGATRLRALAPKDVGVQATQMHFLGEAGRIRDALSLARKLESDHPADARWPVAVATHLARIGREEDAIRSLRRAVRLAPGSSLAWEILSGLKTFGSDDPDLASLERAAAATGTRPRPLRSPTHWQRLTTTWEMSIGHMDSSSAGPHSCSEDTLHAWRRFSRRSRTRGGPSHLPA